jgi:hypothetical protein
VYRSDNVDIGTCSDGSPCFYVGWIAAGEWTAYDVNVTTSGSYNLTFRIATPYSSRSLHVEIDGVNVTGGVGLPNTGSYSTFTNVVKGPVSLSAGNHVLRIVEDTCCFNLNYVSAALSAGAAEVNALPEPTTPSTNSLFVEDTDAKGRAKGNRWVAEARIWVFDDKNRAVEGATIKGNWAGAIKGEKQCVTDASGSCVLHSDPIAQETKRARLQVRNILKTGFTYAPQWNVDPEDDISKGEIVIRKPGGN